MITRLFTLFAVTLAVLLAAPQPAHANDAKKERLVRELLELTGSADLGKQVMDGMMQQFAANPGIPQEFADKFVELADPNELVELIIPIYIRNYDEATLKAVVKFYKSEEGRAFAGALPAVTQESMTVGQRWGVELGQRAMNALEVEAASQPATTP